MHNELHTPNIWIYEFASVIFEQPFEHTSIFERVFASGVKNVIKTVVLSLTVLFNMH